MSEPLPMVLIPGLLCTARLYAEQVPVLWRFGPILSKRFRCGQVR